MQHFYILPHDREYAVRRIQQIDQEIQAMGPDFYEALTQSSETYHDNAPFDALREQQGVLQAEQQTLKRVLAQAHPSIPKPHAKKVSIGHLMHLEDVANGEARHYAIAGHWSYRAGQATAGGEIIISCVAPLAAAFIGRAIGSSVDFRGRSLQIIQLSPFHDDLSQKQDFAAHP